MKRRALIALLAGTAAWPLVARAQQPERMRRIGVLSALAVDDPEGQARIAAFLRELQQLGWSEGRNIQIEYRWGTGDADRIRRDAAELVAFEPDVILAAGGRVIVALREVARAVPIVFTQTADPVGAGFVESLARPGGNTTGFTISDYGMSGKWLEVLKQVAPRLTRAGVLRDATVPGTFCGSLMW
jgi:putative tryptophan/tyrosine transport system substrate-binding protein